MLGYLSVRLSGMLTSYRSSTLARIILISLAAKNRPGQAWRPKPNVRLFVLTLTNWLRAPTSVVAPSRIREKRNGSNWPGLGKISGSLLTATAGTSIVAPLGMS